MKLIAWVAISSLMSAALFGSGPNPIFKNVPGQVTSSPLVISDALVSGCESGEGRCATEFDSSLTWVNDGDIVLMIRRSPLVSSSLDLQIFSISEGARYETCSTATEEGRNFSQCLIVVSSAENDYGEPELARDFSIESSLGRSVISTQLLRAVDWGDLGCVNADCTDTPEFLLTSPPADLYGAPGFSGTAGFIFHNTSKVRASFSSLELSGVASQAGVSILSNGCEGKLLEPKGSCLLTLLFEPQSFSTMATYEVGSFIGPTGFKFPIQVNLFTSPFPPVGLEPRGATSVQPKFVIRPIGSGQHSIEVEIYRKQAGSEELEFERIIKQEDFGKPSFSPSELAEYETGSSEKFRPGCYVWKSRTTILSSNTRSDWSNLASFCIDESEVEPIVLSEDDLYSEVTSIGTPGSSTLNILHHPSWNPQAKTPVLFSEVDGKIIRPVLVSPGGAVDGYPSVFATYELKPEDIGTYVLASIPASSGDNVSPAAVVVGPASSRIEVQEAKDSGKRILDWNFLTPAGTRTGAEDVFEVAYRNKSSTDISSPIAIISMNKPGTVSVNGRAETVGSEIQVIAAANSGPAGILRASGPTERMKLNFTAAEEGQYVIGAQILHSRNSEPIDWASVESQVKPAEVDEATWSSAWQSFVVRAGDTWGGYAKALSEVITQNELAGKRYSRPILVADVLSDYLMSGFEDAFKSAVGAVSIEGRPLPSVPVIFESLDTGLVFESETGQDGSFAAKLPAGRYSAGVLGYLNSKPIEFTMNKERDITGIQLNVSRGSEIRGRVSREIGGTIAEDELVVVTLLRGNEPLQSLSVTGDGEFSFSGLAAGNYQIGLTSRGWAEAQSISQRLGSNTSVELNLVLHEPRAIRGRVFDRDGNPVVDASAILLNQAGSFVAISPIDENGIYAFSRLAPGNYTTDIYFGEERLARYETQLVTSTYVVNNPDLKLEKSFTLSIQLQGSRLSDEVSLIIEDLATKKVLATRASRVGKKELISGLTDRSLRITALSASGLKVESLFLKADSNLVIEIPELQTQSSMLKEMPGPRGLIGNGLVQTRLVVTLYNFLIPPNPSRSPLEILLDNPPPAPCPEAEVARNNFLRWRFYLESSYNAWEDNYNNAKWGAVISATNLAILLANFAGTFVTGNAKAAQTALKMAAQSSGGKFAFLKALGVIDGAIAVASAIQDAAGGDTSYSALIKAFDTLKERVLKFPIELAEELNTIEDFAKGIDVPEAMDGYDWANSLKSIVGWLEVQKEAVDAYNNHAASVSNANNAKAQYEAGIKKMTDAYNKYLQAIIDCGKKTLPVKTVPKPSCKTCEWNTCPWIESNSSFDPNDKLASGFGERKFQAPGSFINYTIRFENIAEATAAARLVSIEDQLEANLDWSTLELIGVEISGKRFEFSSDSIRQDFFATVPYDPYPVRIQTELDPSTGKLTLLMRTWDPSLNGFPANTLAGFLPPNDEDSRGEGSFSFRIRPLAGLAVEETVKNQAEIVFDTNEPIITNVTSNEFDSTAPETSIVGLWDYSSAEFTLSWESSDGDGSGAVFYDIYASINGSEFLEYQMGVTDTQIKVSGKDGDRFSFYVLATDGVGNTEELRSDRIRTTIIGLDPRLVVLPIVLTLALSYFLYRRRKSATQELAKNPS